MASDRAIIWVVDDDRSIRWVLERALEEAGFDVRSFDAAEGALAAIGGGVPDALLTDIRMPGTDGLALLERLGADHPALPVIIMTAHSGLDSAVSAYKGGAFDYLPKPFDIDDAVALVRRAVEHRREAAAQGEAAPDDVPEIIGESPAMQEVFRAIGRLSRSNITVLINGESGTGKELVALALHRHSPRVAAPFVALNMAAIPRDLLESELFGHERGAFTGAEVQRHGRFELANGGTLLLDEVGDMPLATQAKLLRVLQGGEFERLGGTETLRSDVRTIAASNRDLRAAVADGSFREDLFYRLSVLRIVVPALRQRRADIPPLAQHFLQLAATKNSRPVPRLSPEALDTLQRYPWPGNVRELENAIEAAVVLAPSDVITPDALPPFITEAVRSLGSEDASGVFIPVGTSMAEVERRVLERTLEHFGGDKEAAARALGISSRTIYRKLADNNGDGEKEE